MAPGQPLPRQYYSDILQKPLSVQRAGVQSRAEWDRVLSYLRALCNIKTAIFVPFLSSNTGSTKRQLFKIFCF